MSRDRRAQPAVRWMVSGLALYTVVLAFAATRHGPGVSVDSVYYAHGADSFVRSGEITAFGLPLTLWPPGYPVFLGTFLRLGADLESVVLVVNGVSIVATVVLTYVLGRDVLESPRAGLMAAAVVALSSSTVRVFAMLWTEPPFTVLALLVLILLVRAVRRDRLGWALALGLGALVSMATTLRYLGFALVPVVGIGALLAGWRRGRTRAVLTAGGAAVTASVGLVAIAVRNVGLGAAPLGDRVEGGLPIANVVGHSLRALGRYVLPESGGLLPVGGEPSGVAYAIITSLTIAAGLVVAALLVSGCWSAVNEGNKGLIVIAALVVAWWGALIYSTMATGVDPPNERLLAPVLAPMVILAIAGARRISALRTGPPRHWRRATQALGVLPIGLAAVALVAGAAVGVGSAWGAAGDGIGYNAVAVRSSPLGNALAGLPAEVTVASSDPWLAWWVARTDTTTIYDDALKEKVATGEVDYLAFFTESTAPHRTPESLHGEGVGMRLVGDFADGRLYEAVPSLTR